MGGITQSHCAASRDDAAGAEAARLEQRRLDDVRRSARPSATAPASPRLLLDLAVAPVLEAVDLVLLLRAVYNLSVAHAPAARPFASKRDADVAHLAPVLAPRIPDDPVLLVVLLAPAYHRNDAVTVSGDPCGPRCPTGTRGWPTRRCHTRWDPRINLLLHGLLTRNRTVIINRDLRVPAIAGRSHLTRERWSTFSLC